MINEIKGDLLTAKGYILHGVNCRGVMGSGVAKAIREKWPEVFERYFAHLKGTLGSVPSQRDWSNGTVASPMENNRPLGTILPVNVAEDVVVVNCFTQLTFGVSGSKYASYDAMDECIMAVARLNRERPRPINFPLIGCGLGGLHWPVVREIIEHRLPDPIVKNLWVLK